MGTSKANGVANGVGRTSATRPLIYVPMSGFGTRYQKVGYTQPKPLIPVDGVPMIERVLETFPVDYDYLFTINRLHAEQTPIVEVLKRLRPHAKIVIIEPHKDGPVRTLLDTAEHLPDDQPVLLNYCDFGVVWDYQKFEQWLEDGKFDGALTAYKGFHPHLVGPTPYARMLWDGDVILEIREKHQFTDDKMSEYASSGLYWFRTGRDLKRLSQKLVDSGYRVQNEFFVSMVSQLQIEEGQKVGVYELDKFHQWGTPQDLQDWESWATGIRALDDFLGRLSTTQSEAQMVIPMAGLGKRFSDAGYADPKPLIDVGGQPMIAQAMAFLPRPVSRTLIAREEHASDPRFTRVVSKLDPPAQVLTLDRVTEGQAITANIGVEAVDPDRPVLIPPCDAGYVYDIDAWLSQEAAGDADCVVWCAKNHLPSIWYPPLSGWIQADPNTNVAKAMAVKKQVDGAPADEQFALTGTFWFKDGRTFMDGVADLVASNERVNNEFYIDTVAKRMIEQGKRVKAFVVTKFMPWGTPNELKTFEYWNDHHRQSRPVGATAIRKSIVVPCYNEAANLPSLMARFEAIHTPDADWELILVNNGSTDESAAVFERELSKPGRGFIRVVTVPSPNVGYGHGILTGLRAAKGDYLAWTHADGQTPPADVLVAFSLLENSGAPDRTFVKGRRRNRPLQDTMFTMGMSATASALLNEDLQDINAQPKCFSRALLDLATDPPTDLSLDLYFFWLARKNGMQVRTFDVSFLEREHGESKWAFNWRSRYKNIERTVRFMARLRS